MLPVQDVIPSRTTPWATLGLATAILALLLIELVLPEPSMRRLILSYGVVPAHVSWPALLTAPFLHYGMLDAGTNLLALWIFGDNVEDRLGRVRFIAMFVAGAVIAGLVAARLGDASLTPVVGAAGAVGAIIGAHLVLFPASRVLMLVPVWRGIDLVEIPAAFVVLSWVLLTGAITGAREPYYAGLPMAVGLQAAGLLTGAALARLLARPERLRCDWWNNAAVQPPDRRRTSRDTSANSASNASN